MTNVNQKTQQVYWRAEISAFLHFWGVSFKTFSLFFKVLFLLKTIWMKNSNFYQFWAVIAEEWKKFNGCFFKLLSSLPSCYCCGRLNRPLNLTFECRIKTRNILKILSLLYHLWNYELLELSFLIQFPTLSFNSPKWLDMECFGNVNSLLSELDLKLIHLCFTSQNIWQTY